MSSYRSLLDEFERTKRELSEAESTIRRLTGRDPDDVTAMSEDIIFVKRVSSAAKRIGSSATLPSPRPSFSDRKKPSYASRKRSRDRESSYEESSSDEESPSKKPVLQSTVVAKRHQKRSRKATIEEQNANSNIRMRNRRMFSAMVATLTKFQREEVVRQKQESMRAEIESKVEAAREEERQRIKQEKENLFVTRRQKLSELRCLEKKIERANSHEVFDANHRRLLNFIMTKAEPPIFFLPLSHTAETRKAHQESKSKIEELIKNQKENFDNDLMEIEECYRKSSPIPGNKENKLPKEESESQDVPETESESVIVEQEDNDGHGHECNYQNSNSNSNLNSDSDNEGSSIPKNVGSLADQEFEPIYD